MKGYKHTELGWIPEEWEVTRLGSLVKLISGQHLNPDEYNRIGAGIPYFTGPSDYTNCVKALTKWSKKTMAVAKADDILITVKGSGVGSMHYLTLPEIAIGRQVMAIRDVNAPAFIYQYLLRKEYQFRKLATGNMIPGLTRDDILQLEIKTPTLPERKKIAIILSTWDSTIETLTQLIAAKQQFKKGLMQQLLTGKKRLPGFKGKWTSFEFGKVFEFVKTESFSREDLVKNRNGVLYIHYGDIHSSYKGDHLDVKKENRIPSLKDNIGIANSFQYLKEGDLVIADASEDYEGVGECTEIKNLGNKKVIGGLHTIVARDKLKLTSPLYRDYILKNPEVSLMLKKLAVGISVYGISKSSLAGLKILLPSLKEQAAISAVLVNSESEIQLLELQLEILKQQKQGLMQQLLTGKKRVKV